MSKKEEIAAAFDEHRVKRVKLGGFDIDGILRGKYVSLEKFWSIVDGGMGFCDVIFGWDANDTLYDRPGMTGWHTGYPDTPASIDLETFRMIPWEPNTACFLLDFHTKSLEPLPASPRQLLKKVLEDAARQGLAPKIAVEFEFFLYQETAWSLQDKGFRNLRPLDPGMFGYSWLRTSESSKLMHDILDSLEAFGCPLEGFHTETGPGVYEAALKYTDALEAADRAALFKTAMKEICARSGVLASFIAKPATRLPGCGGHIHQSMWSVDTNKNVFYEAAASSPNQPTSAGDAKNLSTTFHQYIAGQIALMPELCALFAPNVNSYKRLLGGDWAPSHATWGLENRTCALRAIPGSEKSTRVEFRMSGADINPYLAIAGSMAAGLYGIREGLSAPPAVRGNSYEAPEELRLPTALEGAVDNLKRSSRARALLGNAFVDHYVLTREFEVRQAKKAVTDWELQRYFELA